MKEQLIGNKNKKSLPVQAGMATLEILLAFTMVILCIGAVIMVSFGNQSVTIDSQTNNEAISKARTMLEKARALSRQDFLSVVSDPLPVLDGIYKEQNTVTDISQCLKQVITNITWKTDSRSQYSLLTTFLSNPAQALALGGDCATSPSSSGGGGSDWHNPQELTDLPRGGLGGVDTNDIDMENGLLYIASGASAANKPDIIIEDTSNLSPTPPIGSLIDDDRQDEGVNHYNAIDVARNNSNGKMYAYLYVGNDASSGQFQIVDVSTPSNISTSPIVKNLPVGSSSPNGGGSIYFYKNKIYIGTGYLVSGNEFQVYCVGPDPSLPACASSSPINPIWIGSFNVNHNIYKIIVRDQIVGGVTKTLAYVAISASSGTPEFEVLDVTNPSSIPLPIGSFNASGNQYGTALYLLGNKAYLGTLHGLNPNFYIIDVSDPTNPTSCANCHFNITNEDINDLVVSNNFAFIITDSALHVLNISDPTNIHAPTVSPFGVYSSAFTSIDLDSTKNLIYASHQNQGSKAFLVLYSAP